jgi:hypothetical protein
MKQHVRAAAAAIALAHSMGRNITGVHDYSGGGYKSISVSISGNNVSGYDYASNCHVSGTLPSLYHYGVSSHLQLTPNGTGAYNGYDYNTSTHFTVRVSGNRADIYDYGESAYFSYSA